MCKNVLIISSSPRKGGNSGMRETIMPVQNHKIVESKPIQKSSGLNHRGVRHGVFRESEGIFS